MSNLETYTSSYIMELHEHVVFFTGTLPTSVPMLDLLIDESGLVKRKDGRKGGHGSKWNQWGLFLEHVSSVKKWSPRHTKLTDISDFPLCTSVLFYKTAYGHKEYCLISSRNCEDSSDEASCFHDEQPPPPKLIILSSKLGLNTVQ